MQFFGEKYGDQVRVVQIGGTIEALNGFSMELCGGTHVSHLGQIGQFRILSEGAVAAGIRRIEAVVGLAAHENSRNNAATLSHIASILRTPTQEIEKKLELTLGKISSLEKEMELLKNRL